MRMAWLKDVKIATKLLLAVVLLVAGALAAVVIGILALQSVYETATVMEASAERVLYGGRTTANLLSFVRNVERLGLNLSAEERDASERAAADELARYRKRLDGLAGLVSTEDGRRNVRTARSALDRYLTTYHAVVDQARRGDLQAAGKSAVAGAAAIAEARRELRELEERNEGRVKSMRATIEDAYRRGSTNLIVLTSGGIVVGVLTITLIMLGVTRPLGHMASAMLSVAGGNYAIAVPCLGQRDEVGQLADALQRFKSAGEKNIRLHREQKELETQTTGQRRAELQEMANAFEAAVGSVVDIVSSSSANLEAAARTLTGTADETQRLSAIVTAASEEASSNVSTVASTTEELSTSVAEIGRQAHESSRIAGQAVEQAQATDKRVAELSEAAQRIGDVVNLITAVAEQTNLLALNATIEAARAGEAGRGFAVVAQEVKALAAQTARATGQIAAQIIGMQNATQDSVEAIKEIGGTIGRTAEIAASIAAAVEQQGAATQEIARSVQQAATGTSGVASNIGRVNAAASHTGSASTQVLASAQALSREGERLKREVAKFLATVRTGCAA
jgi:methyl-accepting chemotaxis protein